jgi:hypothetical protein
VCVPKTRSGPGIRAEQRKRRRPTVALLTAVGTARQEPRKLACCSYPSRVVRARWRVSAAQRRIRVSGTHTDFDQLLERLREGQRVRITIAPPDGDVLEDVQALPA